MKTKTEGWAKVKGRPNLYLRNGTTYYARFKVNGRPVSVSLEVGSETAMTVVAVRLNKKMGEVLKQRTGTGVVAKAMTMGDLMTEVAAKILSSPLAEPTKVNYGDHLTMIRKYWPGNFDALPPHKVSREMLFTLRDAILNAGYSNAYTNGVLGRLGRVLGLARERGLLFDDPMENKERARGLSLWLPTKPRRPVLPSLANMERVFVEMARITPGVTGIHGACAEEPAFVAWRQARATEAAHHARFLAYTGARLEEANAATFADDEGERFHLRGTKTAAADRRVPVAPELRALLTEIREHRLARGLPLTGRILIPHTCRNGLKAACARLGLPKLGHHDLRHWFISRCLMIPGATVVIVAEWAGHGDRGATLLKTYADVLAGHSDEVGRGLGFGPLPVPIQFPKSVDAVRI